MESTNSRVGPGESLKQIEAAHKLRRYCGASVDSYTHTEH